MESVLIEITKTRKYGSSIITGILHSRHFMPIEQSFVFNRWEHELKAGLIKEIVYSRKNGFYRLS